MIALLVRCAIALSLVLVVFSLLFQNDFGRRIRHFAFAIFCLCFAISLIVQMLTIAFRLYPLGTVTFLLFVSLIAYFVVRPRHTRDGKPQAAPGKRRVSRGGDVRATLRAILGEDEP